MKDIFILKTDPKIRSYDVFVKLYKSAKYGEKVLIVLVNLTLLGIFWGCSRMGGADPLSLKPVTHILQKLNLAQLYLT